MILISSMGGCASTSLISWFSTRIECNCLVNSEGISRRGPGSNPKGLKHRITPPLQTDKYLLAENSFDRTDLNYGPIERALFLYDSPYAMVTSLFRRNIAGGHAMAITGKRPSHNNTLETFLNKQEDSFGFYRQFDNWSNPAEHRDYKRLLVSFSALWDNLEYIIGFLGLDKTHLAKFLKKRERKDRFSELSVDSRKKMMFIYKELDDRMKKFPNVVVI